MINESMLNLEKEQLKETVLDTINIKQFFESYLTSNSWEDEVSEFFREVAALKNQSVNDTLLEMIAGTQKYLEAIDIDIEFKNDIPTDINQYANKLKKLSVGIESCWDIFSDESHQFFIGLAQNFCRASSKFKGWKGVLIRLKLLLPSIKQKENLFKIYKESFLFIPRAVNTAIELRESKTTVQLQSTAQALLKRAREISTKKPTLLPFLRHLGRNQEEQIEKNQAAMNWAKARLEEIKSKRNGKEF
jgi:hypothetical protein